LRLHHHIPLLRRPFYQRDEARRQCAALQARVNDVECERDILRAERDRLDEALTNARLDAAATHWEGWCPICEGVAEFRAEQSWWRDHLFCQSCPGGSIPRERAIMQVLRTLHPNWRDLRIHESSPAPRGTSFVLQRDCERYSPTQFWPNIPVGEMHLGTRCENLEHQTFSDESFDVVVTQDVMEHLFYPDVATREIYRTLAPGGLYLFTTPVYDDLSKSVRYAALEGGEIRYLQEPEYHGNPVDDAGSLVTFHYAADLKQSLAEWAPFQVDMIVQNDPRLGIVGEFRHVFACRKGTLTRGPHDAKAHEAGRKEQQAQTLP
jgi:hypothetical protein